ncbi:F0F1 ATP synthase subunit delta [Sulfurimonas sp.]|uniref:F0F1 ATP synthase subunit delta n=1 Tax=Sulfurimonas sp. TaxID=2022749 RepID=UPI0026359EF8|nr:F0F1 ATP synthase subunit delta [Sulfurimonas sp.]
MEELIAKRYIKALLSDSDIAFAQSVTTIFESLSDSFKNEKFLNIIASTNVSADEKASLLLDAVKSANSQRVNNFIKLLVENKRINIIPAIAEELRKNLADMTKTYSGVVLSNTNIKAKIIKDLSKGLSEKYNSKIVLSFEKTDFNGIKVEVDDLGIEINFSKDRINSQIIEHIIKAI